jgi:NADH-quinone oxidoreductase subunit M
MILAWMIIIPLLGGVGAWAANRFGARWSRFVSLVALAMDLVLALVVVASPDSGSGTGQWLAQLNHNWIPQFGISFHLGLDGLSLLLIFLTLFLGFISVLCSWNEVREHVGFFHFNLLWILSGIIGVFLALDLLLFYLFWELMLVPKYLLIGIWGHEKRV